MDRRTMQQDNCQNRGYCTVNFTFPLSLLIFLAPEAPQPLFINQVLPTASPAVHHRPDQAKTQPTTFDTTTTMCKLNGFVFPYCNHGIRVFWRCSTYNGPDPTPNTIPECSLFQDRRTLAYFPCMICMHRSSADNYRRGSQEGLASPAPGCEHPVSESETQAETMERARLARVSSEERMLREGTTLEEEHRRSRESKAALVWARVHRAREEEMALRRQEWFGIGGGHILTGEQMDEAWP
ncbi:hypothetical protein MMC11_003240 [Xylographa trunciseda]|nr:hypothetical protein [Xylographa trunciseda]